MYTDMTLLSREAFDTATDEMVSIDEAVRFLEKELKTRSLRSKIDKYAKGRDEKALKKLLVTGLLEDHPQMKQDSVERRVRGWMNPGSDHSLHKQDAIEAAFLLGLNIEEADDFVAMVSGERLHWRNADEIIYIYALQKRMRYPEASALYERMQSILTDAADTKQVHETVFTSNIRPRVEALESEEELAAFLRDEIDRIGYFHNQAYQMFNDMLDQLQNPVDEEEAESLWDGRSEKLTIRDILREYLFQDNVLYAKGRAVETKKQMKKGALPKEAQFILSKIQKDIADAWPDETTLSKMQSRKTDVTRKVLILLFLATYGGTDAYLEEDDLWDDEKWGESTTDAFGNDDLTREEVFQDYKEHLNYMLSLCGYAPLDPRGPFDWLVLYCICAQDILDIDDRLKEIFLTMFGEVHG